MSESIHCFEQAGLGKAPFRFVGMEYQEMRYGERVVTIGGVECTTKAGGTCAFCGQYIVNMFNVESADGQRFHVGCDCIKKTGDAGLVRQVNEAVREQNRRRRQEKRIAKEQADKAYCMAVALHKLATLGSLPHPKPERAARGEKLADYAGWMIDNRHWETLAAEFRKHGLTAE